MLFKIAHLKAIKSGQISLAFRNWKKQSVNKGSIIKTPIGLIQILDINKIESKDITNSQAKKAGYDNLDELLILLKRQKSNQIYKIKLKYYSEDPRLSLRNNTELSTEEIQQILNKLIRFDRYSKRGNWTEKTLNSIKQNPELRALDLAHKLGMDKDWLKTNVRKLKNLGLTISHGIGYSISPRGELIIKALQKNP